VFVWIVGPSHRRAPWTLSLLLTGATRLGWFHQHRSPPPPSTSRDDGSPEHTLPAAIGRGRGPAQTVALDISAPSRVCAGGGRSQPLAEGRRPVVSLGCPADLPGGGEGALRCSRWYAPWRWRRNTGSPSPAMAFDPASDNGPAQQRRRAASAAAGPCLPAGAGR